MAIDNGIMEAIFLGLTTSRDHDLLRAARRCSHGHVRPHRALLQSAKAPLSARLHHPGPARRKDGGRAASGMTGRTGLPYGPHPEHDDRPRVTDVPIGEKFDASFSPPTFINYFALPRALHNPSKGIARKDRQWVI